MLSHVLFAPLLVLSLSLGLTMGQNISHVVTKTVYQPLFQLEIELFNELLETCTFTINRLENGKLDLFEDEQLGTCSEFAAPLYVQHSHHSGKDDHNEHLLKSYTKF